MLYFFALWDFSDYDLLWTNVLGKLNLPEKHHLPVARANTITEMIINKMAIPTTIPMIDPMSMPVSVDTGDELMCTK